MDEIKSTSQFSGALLNSEFQEVLLSEEKGPEEPTIKDISNTRIAEALAKELGHNLEDFGYTSPRLEHEMPLISKSSSIKSGIEGEQSVGAAGILSLEAGAGGISGYTLDVKSSSLLSVMENERRKQNAHIRYLEMEEEKLAVSKEDKHFFQELKEETKVYEQTHYVENIKARISQIGNKHPLSMQATEAKIQRYEELMERVSKIGTDERYVNLPGWSLNRECHVRIDSNQGPSLNLGSPTRFNLNLKLSPAHSPRDKSEYTAANGDPWETHIRTMQDNVRQAAEERTDNRVARSLVVKANILGDASVDQFNINSRYRSRGIGYEYEERDLNDTNMFFEKDYLRKIAGESSSMLGIGSYDHYEPSHLGNEAPLPQPLASVLNEMKVGRGKSGLDKNDPPILSPSKEDLEEYIASIPGMKRFSPREPKEAENSGISKTTRGPSPQFAAHSVTDFRRQQKKEQMSTKGLSPTQKARVKSTVKKEISREQKKILMRKALAEAEAFMKLNR